ncbi:hypothetical protein DMH88_04220 [Escherichia coli]|nr:hypothetical protein [Escherichia coli]
MLFNNSDTFPIDCYAIYRQVFYWTTGKVGLNIFLILLLWLRNAQMIPNQGISFFPEQLQQLLKHQR